MLSAQYYIYIYMLIVSLCTFNVIKTYKANLLRSKQQDFITGLILLVIITLFIGLRPISGEYFVDMRAYEQTYNAYYNTIFFFRYNTTNVIFDNILPFMASMRIPIELYFLFIATLYFAFMFVACQRLFPKDGLAAFVVYLGAFSSFSFGTNGIKAGLAASFFLFAISFKEKLWISIPLVLVSKGLHHSMTIPIVAYLCTVLYNKPKLYFYFWFFSLVMAAAHITVFMNFFSQFTDEHGADYLLGDMDTYIGFRPDFVLYSAAPVWVGWKALKKIPKISKTYKQLLCMYLLTNSTWMLCMYANFNNRIAYLSWFLYPVVLVYPFLNENWQGNRVRLFTQVSKYHLYFTLFMILIFYNLIK